MPTKTGPKRIKLDPSCPFCDDIRLARHGLALAIEHEGTVLLQDPKHKKYHELFGAEYVHDQTRKSNSTGARKAPARTATAKARNSLPH
jgi:hypothetical protein